MLNPRLIEDINLQNEFINKDLNYFPRELDSQIKKELKYPMAQVIKGIRRSGKTILLKQLLKKTVSPFYFSFDEEKFASSRVLNDIIQYALTQNKKIICLDEIQKVKGWAGIIKKFYDSKQTKFLLSGSSAIEITKGRESLAGRLLEYSLSLLSLKEFREFGANTLAKYLKTGFPELVLRNISPERYIPSIVEKIAYEDIPARYEIHKPEILMDLIQILAERNCNLIDYRDLASDLEASKDTIKTYIQYLQQSYLLDIVPVYSKRLSTSKRRLKKVFFNFPSLPEVYSKQTEGQMIENAVYFELRRHYPVTFWRYKELESDFIVEGIPIEVKYSSRVNKSQLKGTFQYMDKFKVNKAAVICTFNGEDTINGKKIKFIEVEKFLLNAKNIISELIASRSA